MGKKAKSLAKIAKAAEKKLDKSTLPPPPPPVDEIGTVKLVENPSLPGTGYKVLFQDGYDDGGVSDLSLLIDLDDCVLRRKRGDTEYFTALKADLLPRATRGQMAAMTRREQKVSLAQILFSEDDDTEDKGPSEVYRDTEGIDGDEDKEVIQLRSMRLEQAKAALRLSMLLREPACACLSLSELCKRRLAYEGKAGAEVALRCAEKSIEICGEGFWDGDEIAIEGDDNPKINPSYEKNATTPGLANPATLKLLPLRVSQLCLRSAYLQRGNALAALGRDEDARECYQQIYPLLVDEPRCARVDWERHSLYINIGNSYSRSGDYDKANENFTVAENMGNEHLVEEGGSITDGKGMVACAKRARSFALKKAGRIDEAKALLKEVVEQQIKDNLEAEEKKKEEEEAAAKAESKKKDNSDDAGKGDT